MATSLGLVVTPIPILVVYTLSLLVVGGRWVGVILLSKHLSHRFWWGLSEGLSGLHRWCIVNLGASGGTNLVIYPEYCCDGQKGAWACWCGTGCV